MTVRELREALMRFDGNKVVDTVVGGLLLHPVDAVLPMDRDVVTLILIPVYRYDCCHGLTVTGPYCSKCNAPVVPTRLHG